MMTVHRELGAGYGNDTKLLYRSNPVGDIAGYVRGKRVLFVYGGGSVKKNGCYDDVKQAVSDGNG